MELFNETDLKQSTAFSGKSGHMLAALAEMGMSKYVFAAFFELDRVRKDHIRFLTGPIIQHRSPWASSTPEWMYHAAIADRVRVILKEHEAGETGWTVGPAELAAAVYPASMDAPLQPTYADLYLWASAEAYSAFHKRPLEDFWRGIGGEPITAERFTKPGSSDHHHYRRLCADIRGKVVKAAEKRVKAPRGSNSPGEAATDIETEQLSLF